MTMQLYLSLFAFYFLNYTIFGSGSGPVNFTGSMRYWDKDCLNRTEVEKIQRDAKKSKEEKLSYLNAWSCDRRLGLECHYLESVVDNNELEGGDIPDAEFDFELVNKCVCSHQSGTKRGVFLFSEQKCFIPAGLGSNSKCQKNISGKRYKQFVPGGTEDMHRVIDITCVPNSKCEEVDYYEYYWKKDKKQASGWKKWRKPKFTSQCVCEKIGDPNIPQDVLTTEREPTGRCFAGGAFKIQIYESLTFLLSLTMFFIKRCFTLFLIIV